MPDQEELLRHCLRQLQYEWVTGKVEKQELLHKMQVLRIASRKDDLSSMMEFLRREFEAYENNDWPWSK